MQSAEVQAWAVPRILPVTDVADFFFAVGVSFATTLMPLEAVFSNEHLITQGTTQRRRGQLASKDKILPDSPAINLTSVIFSVVRKIKG